MAFNKVNLLEEPMLVKHADDSLTIIPRAQVGSESIAHEADGRMDHWLRGHEGERNNCFSKLQLVGQKYRDKTTLASESETLILFCRQKAGAFRY